MVDEMTYESESLAANPSGAERDAAAWPRPAGQQTFPHDEGGCARRGACDEFGPAPSLIANLMDDGKLAVRHVVEALEAQIRRRPGQALAIAAIAGLVAGIRLHRRK